jgi:hypothetical protein
VNRPCATAGLLLPVFLWRPGMACACLAWHTSLVWTEIG